MIQHPVDQNTPEWLFLRCGMPTASMFHKIVTPKTGELSKQATGYMNAILAELIVGHPIAYEETAFMRRGHELEDPAVSAYEFLTDAETERAGFCTTDDGLIGGSPDRFIGDKKGLEIKCPAVAGIHVSYLLDGALEDEYRTQLQGLLWVTERESWDVVSYYPEMPPAVMQVKRDEAYIGKLSKAVREFSDSLQARIATLIERGLIKPNWRELMQPPKDEPYTGPDLISEDDLNRLIEHQQELATK